MLHLPTVVAHLSSTLSLTHCLLVLLRLTRATTTQTCTKTFSSGKNSKRARGALGGTVDSSCLPATGIQDRFLALFHYVCTATTTEHCLRLWFPFRCHSIRWSGALLGFLLWILSIVMLRSPLPFSSLLSLPLPSIPSLSSPLTSPSLFPFLSLLSFPQLALILQMTLNCWSAYLLLPSSRIFGCALTCLACAEHLCFSSTPLSLEMCLFQSLFFFCFFVFNF